jgi:RNA polymerase sigma-70 factor, ECF subfamily
MSGDRDAFSELAAHSLSRLVGTASLILGPIDAAEDVVQNTLVRAWRDLPSLRDPDRFEPWLYRVLVRACADEARRTRRFARADSVLKPVGSSADHVSLVAEQDKVAAGLRRLDVEHRTVLVMRYYLDMSHEQIAKALGVPIGTVKSRISRALPAMRAALDAAERAEPARPS